MIIIGTRDSVLCEIETNVNLTKVEKKLRL